MVVRITIIHITLFEKLYTILIIHVEKALDRLNQGISLMLKRKRQ